MKEIIQMNFVASNYFSSKISKFFIQMLFFEKKRIQLDSNFIIKFFVFLRENPGKNQKS